MGASSLILRWKWTKLKLNIIDPLKHTSILQLQVFMNNLEDDGDKVLDFENFSVSSHSEKVDHNQQYIQDIRNIWEKKGIW